MKIIFNIMLLVESHMEMVEPAPRRSKYNPDYKRENDIDYDMTTPLGSKMGYNYPYPCRTRKADMFNPRPIYKSYDAGSAIMIKLGGTADHFGGHCEFSISYDKGNTFIVLKTIIGTCMVNGSRDYDVNLPGNIPGGTAIFAWTWINRIGNREFYMNCADVEIRSTLDPRLWYLEGPTPFIGNLPGYPTVPEFRIGDNLTGADHYENRKNISIGNPIPVDPNPETPPIVEPSPMPIDPTPMPIDPTPMPIDPTTPIPIPGKCVDGVNKCNGKDFKTCVFGRWVYRECDVDGYCLEIGNSITCA